MDLVKRGLDIAQNPKHNRWVCPLLLAADALLGVLILLNVSCEYSWNLSKEQELTGRRYRDRLESVHATGRAIHQGRAQLL